MYSERKVVERIVLAEAEFKKCAVANLASAEQDWVDVFQGRLTYHSCDEVDEFEDYLRKNNMYVLDDKRMPTAVQNLNAYARAWMLNEQALCLCDAAYCLTRYGYVKNEKNIIVRFRFRVPQRIFFDIVCELEAAGAAIEILLLKARQLGCSVVTELLIGHRIVFSYGINAVIGSADEPMTGRMSQMLFLFYDNLPIWLKPQWTRRAESSKGLLEFGSLASGVSFQHGAQKHGIGTGTTPTLYHLSEAALYEAIGGREKVIALIEEGLWKAVHASPLVFGVIETTGRGDKGWFPDTWRYSKANWQHRTCRMCPLFLPWFCGIDLYPTATGIATRPIPDGWRPNPDTVQHVAKCELYVESEPLLQRHLLAEQQRGTIPWNRPDPSGSWRMPKEQQWFWECGHEEAKAKGTQGSWYQEMAADDVEALQRSGGEPVFGHSTIAMIERSRVRQYTCWGLSGQSIESVHEPQPEFIDYSRERKLIRYKSPRNEVYRWELIPMNVVPDEDCQEAATGLLIEFEPPRPNVNYSIGCDTSEGRGQDSTAISVWALGWDTSPDRQVAEFTSAFVSHTEAFSFILAIAAYYGQFMALGMTRWKEPYVAIEQVRAVGDVAQAQMSRMGYSNFHRMSRYDCHIQRIRKMKRGKGSKLGWFTYGWSRPILLGAFVHWAKNSWAEVNSPWLLYEMKHFEIETTAAGKEKMEHEEGEHDDRIFAAAMAIFCPHDLDRMDQRSKKRPREELEERQIDIAPVPTQQEKIMAYAQSREKTVLSLEELIYRQGGG